MNNFKKELSVSSGEKKDKQMEFNKRVSLAVLNVLDQMETKNEEEKEIIEKAIEIGLEALK